MTKDTKLSELVINKLTTAQYDAIEEKDPNQLYLVTDGGVSAFDLFDHKWSDHILNDMSWLRADTFSWQDGTVYTEAYNHLLDDIANGTPVTETIGSYSTTYILAPDGHKIAQDETSVANIYNETGVAWYYVLNVANQRFKLPRKRSLQIVSSVKNSDGSWYRLYADGWIEQGGITSEVADYELKTVNLPVEMANTNYTNTFGCGWNGTNDDTTYIGAYCERIQSRTVNSFVLYSRSSTKKIISWQVCGMSAIDMTPFNADEKHLYFYVGQFSQSATEQTAGLNTELFNGKVDIDLGNLDNTNNKIASILNEKGIRTVIDTYQNGTTWYRKYSDGWVEQGGVIDNGSSPSGFSRQVTFPVAFKDTTYSCSSNAISSNPTQTGFNKNSNTVATFYSTRDGGSANARYLQWFACGYSA